MTWKHTTPSSQRLGPKWARIRRLVLERDRYLCRCTECASSGNPWPATEVDHIVSRSRRGTSDMSNLAAINTLCHKRKTQTEMGNRPRLTIGIDGWPLRDRFSGDMVGGCSTPKKRRF
jgi:5-methylcytosine-specific restriction protein A